MSEVGSERWRYPALAATAATAAFVYGWRSGNFLEIYYAAAVRSMAGNWHDFLYGAFDPAGTISVDKLPGALWPQALSVKLLGLHGFSLVLPEVVEGAATALVLYRLVRRLAAAHTSPRGSVVAGLAAAWLLIVSPATAALDRGNIPDSLMILLLTLAANSLVSALVTKRSRHLILAGAYVGLAFQAKMLEAWLILPVLMGVWLISGAPPLARRLLGAGGAAVVTVAVSLSWMAFVQLTPAGSRPYADGSNNDSVLTQVFVYNGFGRVDQSPDRLVNQTIGLGIEGNGQAPGPTRLLSGSLGRDDGWFLPLGASALVGGLVARRRRPRSDLTRAGLLVLGGWLIVLSAAFSASSTVNSYYTAALSPPLAGLVVIGAMSLWPERDRLWVRIGAAASVVVTAAFDAWLLLASPAGGPGWLTVASSVATIGGGVATLAACAAPARKARFYGAAAACIVAVVTVPAVATATIVADRLGPFDTPFEPPAVARYVSQFFGEVPVAVESTLPTIDRARNGALYLMATETAVIASPFIYDTGQEVLPIGGFTGTTPAPTLQRIETLVERGDFHLVLQSPTPTDGRFAWISDHCISLGETKGAGALPGPTFALYYCLPRSVGSRAAARPGG